MHRIIALTILAALYLAIPVTAAPAQDVIALDPRVQTGPIDNRVAASRQKVPDDSARLCERRWDAFGCELPDEQTGAYRRGWAFRYIGSPHYFGHRRFYR